MATREALTGVDRSLLDLSVEDQRLITCPADGIQLHPGTHVISDVLKADMRRGKALIVTGYLTVVVQFIRSRKAGHVSLAEQDAGSAIVEDDPSIGRLRRWGTTPWHLTGPQRDAFVGSIQAEHLDVRSSRQRRGENQFIG